jgi:HAD superfamily hydrolase (TIGR01509 family)
VRSHPQGTLAAVIFDLDGVLVDAEVWWDEVRQTWAAEHGRAWSQADQAAVMGANSLGWAGIIRERLELDLLDQQIVDEIVAAMVERYRTRGAPRIAGAVDAVQRLAATGLPLAIASSSHQAVIDAALNSLGISNLFRVVVASDEVAHGKPAPDVYLLTARRLGVDPTGCLVVEDSLNGVLAGRAAGMTVALVPNASVPPAAGAREAASMILSSLAELDGLPTLPAV